MRDGGKAGRGSLGIGKGEEGEEERRSMGAEAREEEVEGGDMEGSKALGGRVDEEGVGVREEQQWDGEGMGACIRRPSPEEWGI